MSGSISPNAPKPGPSPTGGFTRPPSTPCGGTSHHVFRHPSMSTGVWSSPAAATVAWRGPTSGCCPLGMDELVFNDLHAFQVEATRHVVARLPLDRAPPRITFLAETTPASLPICPPTWSWRCSSSSRDHRSEFRRSPSSPSTPVLFGRGEQPSSRWLVRRDTPEVDLPGFYADLRRRSRRVLVGHGVEPALAENLELTCLPGMGLHQPCYVRCMPTAVLRHAEMMRAASGWSPPGTRLPMTSLTTRRAPQPGG